ncbi:MAG: helix-turn-helix domain-containing protein [Hyphomicrobiaceae bacterium]
MGVAAAQLKERKAAELVGSVGADIRALRKSRSMTLTELSAKLDRSVGFLSQIERGLSQPSISDLRTIADLFGVPISFLFGENSGDAGEARHIVRASGRRQLGNAEGGLIEELLSPDLSGSFEIIRSDFAPGAKLEKRIQRDTEEAGYVISGTFDIEIAGKWHVLREGDSFRFAGEPYRWRNRQKVPAVLIWVIAPPTY